MIFEGFDIYFAFNAVDFMVRLTIVIFLFFITSTLRKSDPDIIRSRLFLEYNKLTMSFYLLFAGSIFFLIAALIEYLVDPAMGDTNFLIMKISLTIFQLIVIYFIVNLNRSISASGNGGM